MREREREMITCFGQPTSLITWLSARTPTIPEHKYMDSPSICRSERVHVYVYISLPFAYVVTALLDT